MAGLVQYVIVRSDLAKTWPLGAIMAQACHACIAVTHLTKEDPHTVEYLSDLDNMHKCVLSIDSEVKLKNLAAKLSENSVEYKMWVEQPEDYPTCLAVKPYPKDEVKQYFKKLKLLS